MPRSPPKKRKRGNQYEKIHSKKDNESRVDGEIE